MILETERLLLRTPRVEDAANRVVAFADPESETWEVGGTEASRLFAIER